MKQTPQSIKITWSNLDLEERLFWLALVLSLLTHGLFCLIALFAGWHPPVRKTPQPKLVYYRTVLTEPKLKKETPPAEAIKESRRDFIPDRIPWKGGRAPDLGRVDRPTHGLWGDVPTNQHKARVPSKVNAKRVVALSFADETRIKNPAYTSYGTHVRMKIRNRAYYYVDDPRFDEGRVYVTFVIERSGRLAAVQILDDRTEANDFLKRVALQSVKEAAPFAPFPKDLDYPALTFNVIISFEKD